MQNKCSVYYEQTLMDCVERAYKDCIDANKKLTFNVLVDERRSRSRKNINIEM